MRSSWTLSMVLVSQLLLNLYMASHFRANFNKALLQENSDQVYNFTARLVNKKVLFQRCDFMTTDQRKPT